MLIKLATWASAFTALLFIVPPPLEHEVHVKIDDINDAVSTDQGLLAMFRSGSHRGAKPVARDAGALHHRLQVAGFSTAVGAAVLLIFGCWLLASALTATQRKLLTALIAREAFDVLMLLASWLSQGDAAIAQLTAAVLSLLAGAVGAYQHLRYTSVRWADFSWSILLCIASIALGMQSCGIKFEVVDAGAGAINLVIEVAIKIFPAIVLHSMPLRALAVEWPFGSFVEVCTASRSCIRWLARLTRHFLRKLRSRRKKSLSPQSPSRFPRDSSPRQTTAARCRQFVGQQHGSGHLSHPATQHHPCMCCIFRISRFHRALTAGMYAVLRLPSTVKHFVLARILVFARSRLRCLATTPQCNSPVPRHRQGTISSKAGVTQHAMPRPGERAVLSKQVMGTHKVHPRTSDLSHADARSQKVSFSSRSRSPGSMCSTEGLTMRTAVVAKTLALPSTSHVTASSSSQESAVAQRRHNGILSEINALAGQRRIGIESQKQSAGVDRRKHKCSLHPSKENVPLDSSKEQSENASIKNCSGGEKMIRQNCKMGTVPRRGQALQELSKNGDVCAQVSVAGDSSSRRVATSNFPVFVDDEFTERGLDQHCRAPTPEAALVPEALASSISDRTTTRTLGQRLDALRAFKCHMASGNLHMAVSSLSSSRDCWSQQEIGRFQSVLSTFASPAGVVDSQAFEIITLNQNPQCFLSRA